MIADGRFVHEGDETSSGGEEASRGHVVVL
jgi:hypothetical protein